MFSHAVLPLMIQLFRKFIVRWFTPPPTIPAKVYGEQDARHLRGFMRAATWMPFVKLTTYKYRLHRVLYDIYDHGYCQVVTWDVAKKMPLDVALLEFIAFMFWDLLHVGVRAPDFWLK